MNSLFGGQFDFDDEQDLEILLDNLNPKVAIKLIEMALSNANSKGLFNLTESHCLYKALYTLKNYENTNTDLRNDDSDGNPNREVRD
jgi:hypothetical protein